MLNYVSCFCMNSLYILDINPFVECVICKYLLPFSRLPFCFDDSYPLLCFLVHCSPIYLFLFLPLKLDPEKITKINVSEVSTYVSSRSFMVLGLTLKSLIHFKLIFACGSIVKESTCNAQDLGLIPRLGRSSGEGKGYPLQYSCWENPIDRGVWWVTAHAVTEWGTTEATDHHQSTATIYFMLFSEIRAYITYPLTSSTGVSNSTWPKMNPPCFPSSSSSSLLLTFPYYIGNII